MDPKTAFEKREEIELIDVREPFEWQAGRIEGARHIPMNDIPARLQEIPGDARLVMVCRSGNRSDHVARYLRAQGLEAENLDGGMKAWKKEGLPITGGTAGEGTVA